MRNVVLFNSDAHRFVLLNESDPSDEQGIPSNQFLIVHQESAVLLDPGGFGVMPRVLTELLHYVNPDHLKAIVLSHQDPDIVGGLAGWLSLCRARVYVSRIWLRFLPHYGLRDLGAFIGVPDEGMDCEIGPGFSLRLLPAHFLHSPGHINVYDPLAKVLFTGDIGASIMESGTGLDHAFVDDFSLLLPHMEAFHRRYMSCNKALRYWVDSVSHLDIDVLAPQHGPMLTGQAIKDFLSWAGELQCGADLLSHASRP